MNLYSFILGCRLYCNFCLLITLLLLQEFKKIKDFKRGVCGEQYEDLEPWDEEYYTALMKNSAYDMDSLVCYAFLFAPNVKNW